jgi:hypothetical protein
VAVQIAASVLLFHAVDQRFELLHPLDTFCHDRIGLTIERRYLFGGRFASSST